jgi:hypothetical protein
MTRAAYCSPMGADTFEKDGTCFDRNALLRLVKTWNASRQDVKTKIRGYAKMSKRELWRSLKYHMSAVCPPNEKGVEACWADNLEGKTPSKEVAKSLRPLKPDEWKSNEYTWLTNYDIEAVMNQYDIDTNPKYKYKFLGVFPIDFQARTTFGQCLFAEFCNLNIAALYKKGVRYIGMITNLDKHNQSGSHWTSLFACIDPSLPSFGAYYYDSVASVPPQEIVQFMETLKRDVQAIPQGANKPFTIKYNKMRHQRGNTECGIFSIDYQIRWIEGLLRDRATKFETVAHMPNINDAYIHEFRNIYFRQFRKKT